MLCFAYVGQINCYLSISNGIKCYLLVFTPFFISACLLRQDDASIKRRSYISIFNNFEQPQNQRRHVSRNGKMVLITKSGLDQTNAKSVIISKTSVAHVRGPPSAKCDCVRHHVHWSRHSEHSVNKIRRSRRKHRGFWSMCSRLTRPEDRRVWKKRFKYRRWLKCESGRQLSLQMSEWKSIYRTIFRRWYLSVDVLKKVRSKFF